MIYTIRPFASANPEKDARRFQCGSDAEALALAERMSKAGYVLEVLVGQQSVGTVQQDVRESP